MGNDRTHERYQAFVHNSSEGIWLIECEKPIPTELSIPKQIKMMYEVGVLAEANEAMARMYGMNSPKELLGARLGDLLVADDPENTEYLTAFIESGYNLQGAESHEIDKDGNKKVFRNSLVGVIEDGNLLRAWGTQQDVTEQILATEKLQKSEERLALALHVTNMGLWEWDVVTGELSWNTELKKLFGLKDGEKITYERYVKLIHPEDRELADRVISDALKSGKNYSFDHRAVKPDGTVHWLTGYGQAFLDKKGNPIRMIGTTISIEDAKRKAELEALNKDLREQREELSKLNQSKDEFISLASHQLRTPATAVKQYIGLILEGYKGKVTKDQLDSLEKAYESNERQLGIINDLLKVAQLDAGKVKLDKDKVDVVPLCEKILADYDSRLKSKNQTGEFKGPAGGAVALVDADRLQMALENIVDNACKYSDMDTKISIEVRARKNEIEIRISDEGIGIRKKDVPKLFEKFGRIQDPLMSEVGGNGLGLYWANKIINLHGGSVDIDSKIKQGSTFIVTLPRDEG